MATHNELPGEPQPSSAPFMTWREIRWLLAVPAAISLIGPLAGQGIWLVELFITGTVDDFGEFCTDTNAPSFVFGAAKNCELEVAHILQLAAVSYGVLLLPLLVLATFLAIVAASIRKKLGNSASSKR